MKLPVTTHRKKRPDSQQESWEASAKEEKYSEIADDYNDEIGNVDERDDDGSVYYVDEFGDKEIDELEADISLKETKQIERIRMEETFKQTM